MSEGAVSLGGGMASNLFSILGGLVCVFAGVTLVLLKAQQDNSMIQSIANGMGFYFVGKGIYMVSMIQQLCGLFRGLMGKSE